MSVYAFFVMVLIQAWLLMMIYISSRRRRASQAPRIGPDFPMISIIVPALNEETTIEPAMRSLLALSYPDYEIIAVNDRSTDGTGKILNRLAAQRPDRLRVVHVTELPAGWLGKCHALDVAARHARGEWLLFTDADVLFAPDALRSAAGYAIRYQLDHLTFFPAMLWHGYVEAALLGFFAMTLAVGFRVWKIESKSLDAYMGIGAFNMIRRSFYEGFGGHLPLRLEVADDMKLGYLAKKHGGRSMAVFSEGQVRVRWREGALDTLRGLERSVFPGIGFEWMPVMSGSVIIVGVLLAPYLLPLLSTSATVLIPSIVSALIILWIYAVDAREHKLPVWIGLLHPVACLLFMYAMVRSALVTTIRGGIIWRGVFYSIKDLKGGSVR